MRVLSQQSGTRSVFSYFSRLRACSLAFLSVGIGRVVVGTKPHRPTWTHTRHHYRAPGAAGRYTCLGWEILTLFEYFELMWVDLRHNIFQK